MDSFGHIDSSNGNFTGSQVIGNNSAGSIGSVGYSLDINTLHVIAESTFDLLIKYGDVDTYDIFLLGYQKPTSLFFTLPTGSTTGQHGLLGGEAINGYYATFCAFEGRCASNGHDFFNFSTSAQYPSSVPCGFYSYDSGSYAAWDDCPDGDNIQQMRYFIRY